MNLGAFGVLVPLNPQPAAVHLHSSTSSPASAAPCRSRRSAMMAFHALADRHPAAGRVLGQVLHLLGGGRGLTDLARGDRGDHERRVGLLLSAVSCGSCTSARHPRPPVEQPELLRAGSGISATTVVAVLGVLAVGIYPAPVIAAAQGAVRALFKV